jgi:ankyrin repeat protein
MTMSKGENYVYNNVNEKNAYDRSVLHKAAYYSGSANLLECLIKQGAHVNAQDKGAWTPLHLAAKNGHVKAIQILLENGANLNVKDTKHGWTPLHVAIISKQYEAANLLIRAGSSISECDKWGNSAQKLFELCGIKD